MYLPPRDVAAISQYSWGIPVSDFSVARLP